MVYHNRFFSLSTATFHCQQPWQIQTHYWMEKDHNLLVKEGNVRFTIQSRKFYGVLGIENGELLAFNIQVIHHSPNYHHH